jgi:hypothetical protein
LRSDRANSSRYRISKIPNTKKGLVEWLKWWSACLASVKPSLPQKKKKEKVGGEKALSQYSVEIVY